MKIIVLFGPPGGGKGTQAKKITEKYNFAHLSTGDIFRALAQRSDSLANEVKTLIERGEFIPDELTTKLFQDHFTTISFGNPSGIILDGYPRNVIQLKDLSSFLKAFTKDIIYIHIDVDSDTLINRLLQRAQIEARKDDTFDVIKHRLTIYERLTTPILEELSDSVHTIYGTGKTIEEVWCEVDNIIAESK